jgi:peptidoglycan/LPS O-acetylase OafA/YrhL
MTSEPAVAHSRTDRVCGLDGLRAIAFLLVLFGHGGFSFVPNGFGVTIFFFLSGYLITTLLRLEWLRSQSCSIKKFYIKRAFRIFPPFYFAVALATCSAWSGLTNPAVQWKGLAAIQLFLTNYMDCFTNLSIPAGLSVLWSLSVEEHFYLVFPCVYLFLLVRHVSRNVQVILFGSVCVLVLVWRIVLFGPLQAHWFRIYTGTDTRIDSILVGVIMAIAANPVIDNCSRLSRRACALSASIGLVVLVASIAARNELFRHTIRYTIQAVALFPIFFYVVRYSDSFLTRLLETRFLTHIADLSYSLYVVHYTVLAVVKTWLHTNPIITVCLTFSVSYLLALFVRRYIERPSYRMRSRILKRPTNPRPEILAAPPVGTPLDGPAVGAKTLA